MNSQELEELYYINSKEDGAAGKLAGYLREMLRSLPRSPIFLCIGSDRVTGDSLGPMIGSHLQSQITEETGISIYGTLEMPVHALNLKSTLERIHTLHTDQPLVAIDASLGVREHLGYITISRGSLSPGAGVNKTLECAGDISITGIIGVSGPFSHITLQTTRLSAVIPVAEQIARGICLACCAHSSPEDFCFSPSGFFTAGGSHLAAQRYMLR
ncbi:MAG: spore protease YyaC [Candidatus Limivivens sp.]|nr:spore protease YyaC [Candidatus Limivivens sp.]